MDSIIFDLDGTLWDSTEGAAIVWKEVVKKNPAITDEVSAQKLKALYGLPLEDIARRLFISVPEEVALSTMEECVIVQNSYFIEHGGILLGNVEETLKKLKQKYKLFIVSNCKSGYIEAFLQAHELEEYITDFECPGRTGLSKAENIKLVIKRNNLMDPVYVGDTSGDESAAKKAGLPFVYARYGFGKAEQYDYVIDSFDEITTIF